MRRAFDRSLELCQPTRTWGRPIMSPHLSPEGLGRQTLSRGSQKVWGDSPPSHSVERCHQPVWPEPGPGWVHGSGSASTGGTWWARTPDLVLLEHDDKY